MEVKINKDIREFSENIFDTIPSDIYYNIAPHKNVSSYYYYSLGYVYENLLYIYYYMFDTIYNENNLIYNKTEMKDRFDATKNGDIYIKIIIFRIKD